MRLPGNAVKSIVISYLLDALSGRIKGTAYVDVVAFSRPAARPANESCDHLKIYFLC